MGITITGIPTVYGALRASTYDTFTVNATVPMIAGSTENDYDYSDVFIYFTEKNYLGETDKNSVMITTLPNLSTGFNGYDKLPVNAEFDYNSQIQNFGLKNAVLSPTTDNKHDPMSITGFGQYSAAKISSLDYNMAMKNPFDYMTSQQVVNWYNTTSYIDQQIYIYDGWKAFSLNVDFKVYNLEDQFANVQVRVIHRYKLKNSSNEIWQEIGSPVEFGLNSTTGVYFGVAVDKIAPSNVGTISSMQFVGDANGWDNFSTSHSGNMFASKLPYLLRGYFTLNTSNFSKIRCTIKEIHEDGTIGSNISKDITYNQWIYLYDVKVTDDGDDSSEKRIDRFEYRIVGITPSTTLPPTCLVGKDHELMVRPNKFKKIKNLKKGDMVYTSHEATLEWGEYEIDNYIETEIDSYLLVKFEDGSEIKCTDTHQFMSEGVKKVINDMVAGDTVMKANEALDGFTDVVITNIELVKEPETCYEIDVAEANTYVTENYIFQHNRKIEL